MSAGSTRQALLFLKNVRMARDGAPDGDDVYSQEHSENRRYSCFKVREPRYPQIGSFCFSLIA
jgi:hypothetical protein